MYKILNAKNKTNNLIKWLPTILLFTLFTTEAYFKILDFSNLDSTVLTKSYKAFLLSVFLLAIFLKKKVELIFPLILILFFLVNQYFTNNGFKLEILIYTSKYFYLIIILIFFKVYPLSKSQRETLFSSFEKLLLFNSIFIFIGFIFNIYIFKTYGNRFGYNGLLITSATSSYVYIITIIYLYTKYRDLFFLKTKNLIIIFSCFLIGTKVIYIFIIAFSFFYIWKHIKFRKYILSILFFISIIIIYIFFFKYGIFNQIREKNGILSSIMSYRNILFSQKTIPYIKNNWSFFNYLFGGINNLNTRSQIGIIDLFHFFGLVGSSLFIYIFQKTYFTFRMNISLIFFFSILFFNVFLAGNFFSYASIVIYLVILKEQILYNND